MHRKKGRVFFYFLFLHFLLKHNAEDIHEILYLLTSLQVEFQHLTYPAMSKLEVESFFFFLTFFYTTLEI